MSSSEPLPPFPDGLDSMGSWPQFPVSNEHPEVNGQYDHDPPSKRAKYSSDNQPMNRYDRRSPLGNPTFYQPTGRIFFKTRHCLRFRMGQCKNGENCNFAHGDEDLRKPPPNWQELVSGRSDDRGNSNGYSNENWNGNGNGSRNGNENWEEDDKIIHKMKLCKKYYNGEVCPFGDKCNFLHKDPPNFRDVPPPPRFRDSSRESAAISIGTTGPPMVPPRAPDQYEVNRSVDPSRGVPRPVYWKTRCCMKFETTGYCPFGDNCHYAHGQAELLLPPGGRPADSGTMTGNSTPLNHVPASVVDPAQVKTEIAIPTDRGQPKKCLFKWKRTKKINRIYGDWIDDLPLILPDEQ